MISLRARPEDSDAAILLEAALVRSFSRGQVANGDATGAPPAGPGRCAVAVNPRRDDAAWLRDLLAGPSKVLLLGRIDDELADYAGVRTTALPADIADWAMCAAAPLHGHSASVGYLKYADGGLGTHCPLRRRPLLRFDFAEEWNNLGYGRITADGGLWSVAQGAVATAATAVALLAASDRAGRVLYAAVMDRPASSLLWINRAAGPIDSAEWRLVEFFFSDYRADELPCPPHFLEIPYGCSAAVTMRLDCDEDIASARPLFDLYRRRGLPFSLAVKTGLAETSEHLALLRDVHAAGGALLSHSITHPPDWGGSAARAFDEAAGSKVWIEQRAPGAAVRYAVSPFHQTPRFAPAGLARAGYEGVVGGLVQCHPDMLLARAGQVPFRDAPFVFHSQQCMMHGDCMAENGDPLAIYMEAFRLARRSRSIFGYLDHPFSDRYAYGWASEAERLRRHDAFLDFMIADTAKEATKNGAADVLFLNEDRCLDFLNWRNRCTMLWTANGGVRVDGPSKPAGLPDLAVGHRGRVARATGEIFTNA